MGLGLKLVVTREGTPVADRVTAALNPPEPVVVTTAWPLWPRRREPEVGETETESEPEPGAVTVSETVVVWVIPPPMAVTVMAYAPVATEEPTAMDIVEVPEPGAAMDDGLKATVTPLGWPLAERAMAELKPPPTIEVMVELPLLPWRTETEPGEAETENDGTGGPVSAAIRPLLGLPQPVTWSKPVTAE